MHVVAPVLVPVFVIEPALQVEQLCWWVRPFWSWYVPALQSVQELTFEALEYFLPTHSVHVVAPVFVPVFVI